MLETAVPIPLEATRDTLEASMLFYRESVVLTTHGKDGVGTTRMVSALDVAKALAGAISLDTGILPVDTLWWASTSPAPTVGLWRSPRKWKVALQVKALEPPERLELPMPGLVFVCSPGQPPYVYAAKRRPFSPEEKLYHAPLFNVFSSGLTCAGNHRYPARVEEIPESFFLSFFTQAGDSQERSASHPHDLAALSKELNGKARYPLQDLMACGTIGDVMNGRRH